MIEIATRVKWKTRPSVNYVKDWHGQLFLIPGLVWKRMSPLNAIIRATSAAIFCIWPFSAWWRTNGQPGDPIASLLLTSEKAVFCDVANAQRKSNTINLQWEPILISQSHFSQGSTTRDSIVCLTVTIWLTMIIGHNNFSKLITSFHKPHFQFPRASVSGVLTQFTAEGKWNVT